MLLANFYKHNFNVLSLMNTWLSRTECSQGREPLRGSHECREPPAPPPPSHRPSPRRVSITWTQTQNSRYLDVAESLVKVVDSEADKRVGHLLTLRLWVHSPMRRWGPNFLSTSPQNLKSSLLLAWPPRAILYYQNLYNFVLYEHGTVHVQNITWRSVGEVLLQMARVIL